VQLAAQLAAQIAKQPSRGVEKKKNWKAALPEKINGGEW
jgi:hypothetical protein